MGHYANKCPTLTVKMTDVLNDDVPGEVFFAEDHSEPLDNLDEMAPA